MSLHFFSVSLTKRYYGAFLSRNYSVFSFLLSPPSPLILMVCCFFSLTMQFNHSLLKYLHWLFWNYFFCWIITFLWIFPSCTDGAKLFSFCLLQVLQYSKWFIEFFSHNCIHLFFQFPFIIIIITIPVFSAGFGPPFDAFFFFVAAAYYFLHQSFRVFLLLWTLLCSTSFAELPCPWELPLLGIC